MALADRGCIVSLDDAPDQHYGCVYADPPWAYANSRTRAAAKNHYPVLSTDALLALPVNAKVLPRSHLHLWTTNAFLPDALRLVEAWGFEYKSMLVWVKPQMGMGNYWRVSHELLLLGVRGTLPFQNHSYQSWIESTRLRHSQKPARVRAWIEDVSPGPRLELFGRRTHANWTVFGNEVEQVDELFT